MGKFLVGSYSVDGVCPSKNVIVSRLQEKFPVFHELFFKTIDPDRKEKARDNEGQLMWNFSEIALKKTEAIR